VTGPDLASAQRAARLLYDLGAQQVWICGSLAHGLHSDDVSDLDYAVLGLPAARHAAARATLGAATGRQVDVIRLEEAPGYVRVLLRERLIAVDRYGSAHAVAALAHEPAPVGLTSRPLPRGLHRQRHEAVCAALERAGAARVVDLGCGRGELLSALVARDGVRATGVDPDPDALAAAHTHLATVLTTEQRTRVRLHRGTLDDLPTWWDAHDAIAAVEVIEHLDEPALAAFGDVALGALRPATVVVTTPNADFNALLPGRGLRHPDHRFEWGREQLRSWAIDLAGRYGYVARTTGVGVPHPDCGPPSQLCVFTRDGR